MRSLATKKYFAPFSTLLKLGLAG